MIDRTRFDRGTEWSSEEDDAILQALVQQGGDVVATVESTAGKCSRGANETYQRLQLILAG